MVVHLSIVECSDYSKYRGMVEVGTVTRLATFEKIGPVLESNASKMRNRGAIEATGEWIFFKDHDCTVDVEILKKVLKNHSDYDVIGGIYKINYEGSYFSKIYNKIQRKWLLKGIVNRQKNLPLTRHLLGGAVAVKRSVFEESGGFSEIIGWGGEETDFIRRLSLSGKKIGISYRLKVYHSNKGLSFFGFLKRAWVQNFNLTYFRIQDDQILHHNINYLKANYTDLIGLLVFFATGQVAQVIGKICRQYGRSRAF